MLSSGIVYALDRNIQEIAADVVRMLSLVRESCQLAKQALIDGDQAAAAQCVENDHRIDALQEELEQKILTVIARRQPAARDLRFLGAMHRALSDIERAGDYAEHVARTGAELATQPQLKKYTDMQRIFVVLSAMIEKTMQAIAEGEVTAARQGLTMDDEIDDLYQQIQRELLTYMMENPKVITTALKLMNIGRYLERLGDHLENVNEHTIFWLTGERL